MLAAMRYRIMIIPKYNWLQTASSVSSSEVIAEPIIHNISPDLILRYNIIFYSNIQELFYLLQFRIILFTTVQINYLLQFRLFYLLQFRLFYLLQFRLIICYSSELFYLLQFKGLFDITYPKGVRYPETTGRHFKGRGRYTGTGRGRHTCVLQRFFRPWNGDLKMNCGAVHFRPGMGSVEFPSLTEL